MAETSRSRYTSGEATALVAPLAGLEPEELQGYLIVGVHKDGRAVLAGSGNLPGSQVPSLLAQVLAGVLAAGGLEDIDP